MATIATGFDLAGCLKAAAAIEADLTRLATALTEAQFHAPPRAGGWSVGYCIEHLVLTGQALLPKWDAALKKAAEAKRLDDAVFPYAWWQRRILEFAENPSRLKQRTTPPFLPYSRQSIEATVRRFLGMHREMAGRLAGSRGLNVRRTKVQSPSISWIRYGLGFSFDLALAHERRHLHQAWRVRRQLLDGLSNAGLSNAGPTTQMSFFQGNEWK
jgi:DinB family protein